MSTSNTPSTCSNKPCISTFLTLDDFEKQNEKNRKLDDFNEECYNKAKQIAETKINLVNKQINNFGVYIHSANTSKYKSSFKLSNYNTYDDYIITSLEEFKKVINSNSIYKYNYTEQIYLNVSRIFFDIDFKENDKETELEYLLNIIMSIAEELHATKYYGLIEVADDGMYNSQINGRASLKKLTCWDKTSPQRED